MSIKLYTSWGQAEAIFDQEASGKHGTGRRKEGVGHNSSVQSQLQCFFTHHWSIFPGCRTLTALSSGSPLDGLLQPLTTFSFPFFLWEKEKFKQPSLFVARRTWTYKVHCIISLSQADQQVLMRWVTLNKFKQLDSFHSLLHYMWKAIPRLQVYCEDKGNNSLSSMLLRE